MGSWGWGQELGLGSRGVVGGVGVRGVDDPPNPSDPNLPDSNSPTSTSLTPHSPTPTPNSTNLNFPNPSLIFHKMCILTEENCAFVHSTDQKNRLHASDFAYSSLHYFQTKAAQLELNSTPLKTLMLLRKKHGKPTIF